MTPEDFRQRVRGLVASLGVLDDARTPCGLDVSVREAYALATIASAEARNEPLSQSELQAALHIDKSNVTRLVQLLVESGRAEQLASAEDSRVRLLRLTAKGRKQARMLEERSLSRFAAVLERIPKRQHGAVVHALDLICEALNGSFGAGESWTDP